MKRNPVLAYYCLTFVISWGGFLLAGGPGLLTGSNWESDPRFLAAVSALLLGPPVAGLLLTYLSSGSAGLRDLLARTRRWRVAPRWYAVALLTAPMIQAAVLWVLSRFSPVYLPSISTAEDKAGLVVSGIVVGLTGGLMEETGWTGFALPRLRLRPSDFTTGITMGILWGAWHLPQMWWVGRTSAGSLPTAAYLLLFFATAIAALTAFRVLMVWVYARTESVLIAVLMHASYIWTTLFVLAPPTAGVPFLVYSAVFVATLWGVVAGVSLLFPQAPRST